MLSVKMDSITPEIKRVFVKYVENSNNSEVSLPRTFIIHDHNSERQTATVQSSVNEVTSKPSDTSTPMLQSSVAATGAPGKRKVTLIVDGKKDEEEQTDDVDKIGKQVINLTSVQQRIRRKVKDMYKKISKHRHVYVEKNYEQELADRDDDAGDAPDEDVDAMSTTEDVEEENPLEEPELDETLRNGEEEEAMIDETTVDDRTEKSEDDDDDEKTVYSNADDTSDGEDDERDDETDPDGVTEDTMMTTTLDDEIVDTFTNNGENDARINFGDSTMSDRILYYKTLLETQCSLDFGDISELQPNGP